MNTKEWLKTIGRGHAPTRMAEEAGLYRGTFSRQYNADKVPPDVIVAIARAYKADPLEGLVAAGLLTEEEVDRVPPMSRAAFLDTFTDLELLEELMRRVRADGEHAHPLMIQPLDENHPALRVVDEEPDFERMAAFKPPYDPDEELTERHDT